MECLTYIFLSFLSFIFSFQYLLFTTSTTASCSYPRRSPARSGTGPLSSRRCRGQSSLCLRCFRIRSWGRSWKGTQSESSPRHVFPGRTRTLLTCRRPSPLCSSLRRETPTCFGCSILRHRCKSWGTSVSRTQFPQCLGRMRTRLWSDRTFPYLNTPSWGGRH
jgi:hypothetical protein